MPRTYVRSIAQYSLLPFLVILEFRAATVNGTLLTRSIAAASLTPACLL